MASIWCEVTLAVNGFPGIQPFLPETREVAKSSQAVPAVFFRQTDAAIVPPSVFETAAALNPQAGQQLGILAASPSFSAVGRLQADILSRRDQNKVFGDGAQDE